MISQGDGFQENWLWIVNCDGLKVSWDQETESQEDGINWGVQEEGFRGSGEALKMKQDGRTMEKLGAQREKAKKKKSLIL